MEKILAHSKFSDYVVYVGESGDHSLTSIDKNYPMFVLAFCVFKKCDYLERVLPDVLKLKYQYFGHDFVILHEHEIRKEVGDFNIFTSKEQKLAFLDELSKIMAKSPFELIACTIEKHKLTPAQIKDLHAYHYSLKHCLETLFELMLANNQADKITFVAVESRGIHEDRALELEFLRICHGKNKFSKHLPFIVKIVSKKTNSVGLQLADLVARPIGRYVLDPSQDNRAMDILKDKFYGRNTTPSKGLIYFPQTSERS